MITLLVALVLGFATTNPAVTFPPLHCSAEPTFGEESDGIYPAVIDWNHPSSRSQAFIFASKDLIFANEGGRKMPVLVQLANSEYHTVFFFPFLEDINATVNAIGNYLRREHPGINIVVIINADSTSKEKIGEAWAKRHATP